MSEHVTLTTKIAVVDRWKALTKINEPQLMDYFETKLRNIGKGSTILNCGSACSWVDQGTKPKFADSLTKIS